jgi:hypothetical protein
LVTDDEFKAPIACVAQHAEFTGKDIMSDSPARRRTRLGEWKWLILTADAVLVGRFQRKVASARIKLRAAV